MSCLPGDVPETLSLEKLKIGLSVMQENMWRGMTPTLAAGMSHATDGISPSYISGTLPGCDSPKCGMGFYFQLSASCPGIHLALLRTWGVEEESNTRTERYSEDQRRESACVRWGCAFSLVRASVTPTTSSKECTYSSEGETIPSCLFLFNIVYTENGETHL